MENDPARQAWTRFVNGLSAAGDIMDSNTTHLDPVERADGFRAITRITAALLEKLEMDGLCPEAIRDNTPNHKWFMDNPDGLYWHIVVDSDQAYRIKGNLGEACYTSITAYYRGEEWYQTHITASISDAELQPDEEGSFELTVSPEQPSSGVWLPLKEGTWLLWIRQFVEDVRKDKPGWFAVENLKPVPTPPVIEPEAFGKNLEKLGQMVEQIVGITVGIGAMEATQTPNEVRKWEEMQGGAVFTLGDIDYMRGSWNLAPDEALVLEGRATACKHWNIVLYSRFLNSLEHRHRPASLTGSRVHCDPEGNYRLILAAVDPGVPNWLDTEGRPFGIFAIRWLFPAEETVLPTAWVVKLSDICVGS